MKKKQVNYLRAMRERASKTQLDVIGHLEKELGRSFSQPFFSAIENNAKMMPIDWLKPLSEFLNCSIDEILKGE